MASLFRSVSFRAGERKVAFFSRRCQQENRRLNVLRQNLNQSEFSFATEFTEDPGESKTWNTLSNKTLCFFGYLVSSAAKTPFSGSRHLF
jgi:hypothetical protein